MCVQSQLGLKVSLVMLLVYGDESFDEKHQRICALSGIIGREEQWARLEKAWIERNNGVPFHATDCDTDSDIYGSRDHAHNKELYKDLTLLLANSGLYGYASVLDLRAVREYFPDAFDLGYYRAFWHVLDEVQNIAGQLGELAKLTLAARAETDYNALVLYANLRNSLPEWKERICPELSSVPANESARVQAGDLFAREAMKAIDNLIGPVQREPRKSWIALRDTKRFGAVLVN